MSFLDKIKSFFNTKKEEKPDIKTVSFDSEGNVINHPTFNPTDGTPAEIKKLAKNLYNKIENLGKKQ